ncbi:MAG: DUF3649 domain-containing protein [Comamonas sp.]|uniref:DUF3649 domain-containing protein n=1 Tax=Comamonas sp. TaxID=34028 RepID=UPI002FC93D46
MTPGSLHYRCSVAARVLAAALGGYLLTSALATLLALLLPFERAQAVMAGSDIGVLFYLPALLWAFHARSAVRAWAGLLLSSAAVAAACWWLAAAAA